MQGQHDPYHFIHNSGEESKKSPLSDGSKKSRILVVVFGLMALLIVVMVVMALFSASANKGKKELLGVAQQQTEIIRISKLGNERARGSEAKNLAMTTSLSVQSDQTALFSATKKLKIKINSKQLGLAKNAKTDAALTQAEQSNKFDAVFIQTIKAQLAQYQKSLSSAHENNGNESLKALLVTQHTNAGVLAATKQ